MNDFPEMEPGRVADDELAMHAPKEQIDDWNSALAERDALKAECARLRAIMEKDHREVTHLLDLVNRLHPALKRVTPWLGKLIADKGHLNSVAPNDAVGALQQAEAALAYDHISAALNSTDAQ